MKKQERKLYYRHMESTFQFMSEENQARVEFVKAFMKNRLMVDEFDDSYINFERMGTKSLLYLLWSMILEYDEMNR